jgi:hypothetical protein
VSALALVADSLATYRLTRLVVEDQITVDVREWIWKHHSPEETKLGYLITCPYCVSVWAGAVIALSHTPPDGVVGGTLRVLRNTLALSGAVALVHEALDRTG